MERMDDMSDLSELFPDMPQDGIDHALSFDDLTGLDDIDFMGSPSTGVFGDADKFSQPNQQVILKEQEALGRHRRGTLVHSYSANDLGLLSRESNFADIPPQGRFPLSPCDSPPSSAENGYSRSGTHPLQQLSPGSKGSHTRLESIPEITSMGHGYGGPAVMAQLETKPLTDMDFMAPPSNYGPQSTCMYSDASGMTGSSMPHMMPMEQQMPMHAYPCPGGVGSPALLPGDVLGSGNIMWADVNPPMDVTSGIMSPPPNMQQPGPPGPGGSPHGRGNSAEISLQESKMLQEFTNTHLMANGQNGKPPVAPVPQHSGDSVHSQALSSGSSGGPPPLPNRRSMAMPGMGGMGSPQMGPPPQMHGMPMVKNESFLRRTQSAVELRTLSSGMGSRRSSATDLNHMVELTTPEGHTYRVGRLSHEERNQKILRYRQKRHERNFTKRIKYQCRKTLADSRPRVRGRFARNNDEGAVLPHETKKAMKARVKQEQVQAHAGGGQQGKPGKASDQSKKSPTGGQPPLIHSTAVQSRGPGQMPHSPQYSHSPSPSPVYMSQHHMYSPQPMSQVPQQSYMTSSYGMPTRYHPQQAGQQQYHVMSGIVHQQYPNGGYPNGTYDNSGYAGSVSSAPPQAMNGGMMQDMQTNQMYHMYHPHGPMNGTVSYAPTMSHPQQG